MMISYPAASDDCVKCLQLYNEEQFDPQSFVTRFQICSGSLEFEEKCLLVKILIRNIFPRSCMEKVGGCEQ